MSQKRIKGKIVYWNGEYGFIEGAQLTENLFFHRSNLVSDSEDISLFDEVTFKKDINTYGQHSGKAFAKKVKVIAKGDFQNFKRYIGTIENWNGKYGFIESSEFPENPIFLYHTRLVLKEIDINKDEYYIFEPIKSSKDHNQLFAFFAYPLEQEKDIDFLINSFHKHNKDPKIGVLCKNLIRSQNEMTTDERFAKELELLVGNNGYDGIYMQLKEIIELYWEKFNFKATYNLLSEYLSGKYLIQLWINGVISTFEKSLLIEYFNKSLKERKVFILKKLNNEIRGEFLENHFRYLLGQDKITRSNKAFKTYLDLVFRKREELGFYDEIYQIAKNHVLNNFIPKEIITLWVRGYIDELPFNYIKDNFDLDDIVPFGNAHADYLLELIAICEDYLLTFPGKEQFESDYPTFVRYYLFYHQLVETIKEQNEEEAGEVIDDSYSKVAKAAISQLDRNQKFTVWLFESKTPFDGDLFFDENWQELNVYFLLKYLVKNGSKKELFSEQIERVTESELIIWASTFQWNSLIEPVSEKKREKQIASFLKNVEEFVRIHEMESEINLQRLGQEIYETIPFCTVYHIRLWLQDYVKGDRYDFTGYRDKFKELNKAEKALFKSIGTSIDKGEVIKGIINEVLPCEKFEKSGDGLFRYFAFVENIFFENGKISLRRENKEYTEAYELQSSSLGFNGIPINSHLNKIEFEIEVKGNDIIKIKGFEDFITEVQTSDIEGILGIGQNAGSGKTDSDVSYVEDWEVKKQIINYLGENQAKGYDIKVIDEPKFWSRVKDEMQKKSKNAKKEKVSLYTLSSENGLGIVWENIDMAEDRATYVFKCSREEYSKVLKAISSYITKYRDLRSTLIRANKSQFELDLSNSLGFISSIKKKRGSDEAFENWERQLWSSLEINVPKPPGQSRQLEIYNYFVHGVSPDSDTLPKPINTRIRVMDPKDLGIITNDGENESLTLLADKLNEFNKIFEF